jgi:hypothetical protein
MKDFTLMPKLSFMPKNKAKICTPPAYPQGRK